MGTLVIVGTQIINTIWLLHIMVRPTHSWQPVWATATEVNRDIGAPIPWIHLLYGLRQTILSGKRRDRDRFPQLPVEKIAISVLPLGLCISSQIWLVVLNTTNNDGCLTRSSFTTLFSVLHHTLRRSTEIAINFRQQEKTAISVLSLGNYISYPIWIAANNKITTMYAWRHNRHLPQTRSL